VPIQYCIKLLDIVWAIDQIENEARTLGKNELIRAPLRSVIPSHLQTQYSD